MSYDELRKVSLPEFYELSLTDFRNLDEEDLMEQVLSSIEGIDQDTAVFCGFPHNIRESQVVPLPRSSTYGVTLEEWRGALLHMGGNSPIEHADKFPYELGSVACMAIYDGTQIERDLSLGTGDGSMTPFIHNSSNNIQDALLGMVVFKQL